MAPFEVDTPHGPARVHLHRAEEPRAALLLGHGAGGGVGAADLGRAKAAALQRGVTVALVEQPYRVAGRRSPAPAHQLDAAWKAVAARLRSRRLRGLPLVVGGRSSGARVACRTAEATGAAGVLCLAFPLQPPARQTGKVPESRLPELDAVPVPVLVVQGRGDAFGMPPPGPRREVVRIEGDHALRKDHAALGEAVGAWLDNLLRSSPATSARELSRCSP